MKIIPFAASLPKLKLIASADSFFGTVKYDYPLYRQNGFFEKHTHTSIFVYRIRGSSGKHIGMLACADIDDYLDGKILKHENTLAAKEQEMINLLIQRKAMVKPVMLAHKPHKHLSEIYKKVIQEQDPAMTLVFENLDEVHELWDVRDEETIRSIQDIFEADIEQLYIADGHHRTSTNAYLYQNLKDAKEAVSFKKLLSGFFAFDQYSIYDYNRCVEALTNITPSHFIAQDRKSVV